MPTDWLIEVVISQEEREKVEEMKYALPGGRYLLGIESNLICGLPQWEVGG